MQNNLRLIMWTIVILVAAWVITMTIQRNLFLYTDTDGSHGTIAINKTDIGAKCGEKWVNSNELVIYKVNNTGQLVFLCPRGLWPVADTVIAAALTNDFKALVSQDTLTKLNVLYPGATNPIPAGAIQQVAEPVPIQVVPTSKPVQQPYRSTAAPPNTPVPTTTNPFLGAPKQQAAPSGANPFLGAPKPQTAPAH